MLRPYTLPPANYLLLHCALDFIGRAQ